MMESTQIRISEIIDIDMDGLQQIEDTDITHVNSYSSSSDSHYLIICTENGIFIVHNPLFVYKCYLNKNSPFWIENVNFQIGVKMGSLVQSRNEAAVIPNFSNKYYNQNHVYIFDYQMKCILHSIDFFLPIEHLKITDSQIFVSNKKRVIIYNYLDDSAQKDQKYYLNQYLSKQPNNSLRYLDTHCEDYDDPLKINQIVEVKQRNCLCGTFYLTWKKPLLLAYPQTFNQQNKRKICLYSQKVDTFSFFDQNLSMDSYFQMALSTDGQYLAYTFNDGRNINVYNLKENKLYCVLYVSSRVRDILKMEFFKATIQQVERLCLGVIRNTNTSTATLHVFVVQNKPPTQQITSKYRRYFPLYENLFQSYGISQTLISPGFFIHNNWLYIYSICGRVFEAIEFSRAGNFSEVTYNANDFHKKWVFEQDLQ